MPERGWGKHLFFVMPGLDPGIHAITARQVETPMEWIAGIIKLVLGPAKPDPGARQ
jgi:hypothetical protein